MRFFVIGAGLWGSVIAERIASVMNEDVLVIDKRNHIGGNCYSYIDAETGIECHQYGTHAFHTSLPEVWNYLHHFTEFTSYRHQTLTVHNHQVYTMPINLFTINAFYGKNFSPEEAAAFLQSEIKRDAVPNPSNLEEKALSLIGRPLYEAFIKNYTQKQWERDPKDLPSSIITRLPFRTTYNLRYFSDLWEGLPQDGYFALFENLLKHPKIHVRLNCDYRNIRNEIPSEAFLIYTGMPDEFFDYKYGELEWRSLRFEWKTLPIKDFQGTPVVNYADLDVPWTRIHEYKHYNPERKKPFHLQKTIICKEYPTTWKRGDEAYYPINDERNNSLYAQYAAELAKMPRVIFGGRLGTYRYFDMDKTVNDALSLFKNKICLL